MRKFRAAVVGAGHVGRQHARIWAELAARRDAELPVELAAVVDVDLARARDVAARSGGSALASLDELEDGIDLASVAVPTRAHVEVAAPLIRRGVAVLVEKPLAATRAEALPLAELARARRVVLQVGHVERFNPALRAARRLGVVPRFIEAQRLAPFPFRSADVGVVHDLMIHDLDVALSLVASPLTEVRAAGGAVVSGHEDLAQAWLEFADGTVASLAASRVSPAPRRRLRVFGRDALLSLDYLAKRAFVVRRSPDGVDELAVDGEEPLHAELASFLRAVATGGEPEVTADDALRALAAADAVVERIRARRG